MKKCRVIVAPGAVIAALASSGPVAAQDRGAYLGGAFGQSTFKEWCDTGGSPITLASCEDTDSAWKAFGGYRFGPNFALEGSYIEWGDASAATSTAVSVAANQRSYGLAAVGSLEVAPRFSLFGKVGFLMTEQETRRITPNPSTFDRDETELHYGLGAKYGLTQNLALRAEWENTEKLKVQMLSVGVEYRF